MRKKNGKVARHLSTHNPSDFTSSELVTKDAMIHEHDFAQTNLVVTTACFAIQCTTCKKYFCDLCGKVLNDLHDIKFHICNVN